jgi:hypothetical protein
MKQLLWIFAFLIIVGCTGQTIKPEKLKEIESISFVNLMNEEIAIQNVGTTIFNNEEKTLPFPKFEQFLLETNEKLLPKNAFKSFAYPREEYQKWRKEKLSGITGFFAMPDEMDFTKEYFLPLAEKAGVRHLLVFSPVRHDNYALYPPGYGVFCRSAFGIQNKATSYALFSGRLWDVKSKDWIYFEFFTPNTTSQAANLNCDELSKLKNEELAKLFLPKLKQTFHDSMKVFWQKAGMIKKEEKAIR